MRLQHYLTAAFAAGVVASSRPLFPRDDETVSNSTTVIPNRFIIEVGANDNINDLKTKITKSGGRVVRTFDTEVFKGLSIESEAENLDTLQALKQVVQTWPVNLIKLDPISPVADFGAQSVDEFKDWDVHAYTGVEEAHKAGYLGKGAIVAVVDTGVEYTHEALGGCFGEGCKVAGGYDLVGDGEWPYEDKTPDQDPLDYQGHGTHVTGIIAGKSDQFVGVAPDATIFAYKVMSTYDYTDEDTLIAAFLKAYEDGADIITSSIGGPNGFTSNAWAVVASRIVDAGVVVTIAAGNSGDLGPFWASNGASGANVLAIASTDAEEVAADLFNLQTINQGPPETSTAAFFAVVGEWRQTTLPLIPLSTNTSIEDEACNPLPSDTPDLSGKIILVRQGGCDWYSKEANLRDAGAEYILGYLADGPFLPPNLILDYPDFAIIEAKTGEKIVETVKAGGVVFADFSAQKDRKVGISNSAGGRPSAFTSWGGTFELDVKPDIAAPGGYIYSSFVGNSYIVASGTSMACPYVAGIAALWVGKNGGRKSHGPEWARDLHDRIISSGRAVPWRTVDNRDTAPVDTRFWAPGYQVGAGQVDAWKVLSYDTVLSFDKIALNDTGRFRGSHEVEITNGGKEDVTYTFEVQAAGGFELKEQYTNFTVDLDNVQPVEIVPEVSFPEGKFTVVAGQSKVAKFEFEPIKGVEGVQWPAYSGKILITGSNGEKLSVPYQGLAFDLKEAMLQNLFSDTTPFQIGGAGRDDINIYNKYTFNLSWYEQSFPKVVTELNWGSKEIRWDIFDTKYKETNWTYPPVIGENGYVGSVAYYRLSGGWGFDTSYEDPEDTLNFPVYDVIRTSSALRNKPTWWWLGKLANGSYIEPGQYQFRFAALIPFGDPQVSDNWDIWNTPVITVLPLER